MSNIKSRTYNSMINIVTSLGGQLVLIIIEFVCRTVFIRTLGTEYLGINGLFTNILSVLSLTELGLDTAMNFKLYKPLKENDHQRICVLMKFYRQAYLVVGLVILGIGLCLIPALPVLVKDYETFGKLGLDATFIFILFLLKSVTSYLFFASRSAILKADQKSYITNLVSTICIVVLNIVQIITLILFRNFILYTVLAIGAAILSNLISAAIAKRQYKYAFAKTTEKISKEEFRDIFKDLGALFVFRVNGVVNKAADNLILSSFIGLKIVGLYSNYLIFYTTIRTLLGKVYDSVKASMGNLFADDDVEKHYRFFEIMNYVTFLLYGTACAGVVVVADEIIANWLGADFVIIQPLAMLMGIEVLLLGLNQNLNQIRVVSGAFRQMWTRPIWSIVINIVVSIIGVNICGIYGVLIGTLAAGFLTNFMVDPRIIHRISLKNYRPVSEYYKRNFIYMGLLAAVTLTDYFICKYFVAGFGWISVAVHILIMLVTVPGVFLLVFRKKHEAQYVKKMVRRILKKRGRKKG